MDAITKQARSLMAKCYFGLELEGIFNFNTLILQEYYNKYNISDYHNGHFNIFNPYNNKNKTIKLKIERDGSLNLEPRPRRLKEFESFVLNHYKPCEVVFSKYCYKNLKNRLKLFLQAINSNGNRLNNCYFNTSTGAHIHISLNKKFFKGNLRRAITQDTIKTFLELKDTIKTRATIKKRIFRNYARLITNIQLIDQDRYSFISYNRRYNTIELRYINLTDTTTIDEVLKAIDEQLLLFFKTLILQARDTQQQDAINLDIDQEPIINNVNYTY